MATCTCCNKDKEPINQCMFCTRGICSPCYSVMGLVRICDDCAKQLHQSTTPHKMFVCAGRSHPELASEICKILGVPLGQMKITDFDGGEIKPQFRDNIRGRRVVIIQPTVAHSAELGRRCREELRIMVRAAKLASAHEITVVIPDFAYQRQERKTSPRIAITARLEIDLLETAGVDRFVFMDLHAEAIQGFASVPVDHLWATPLLLKKAFSGLVIPGKTVFLTDAGYAKIVGAYARHFGVDFAIAHKEGRAEGADQVSRIIIIGDVKGKIVLLLDDIVKTGFTMIEMAKACLKAGAIKVYGGGIHGELPEGASDRVQASCLEYLAVTDSVDIPKNKLRPKIRVVSVAELIAKAIEQIYEYGSVSQLFDR